MPKAKPFTYLPIIRELSYAIESALYCSDLREGLRDAGKEKDAVEIQELATLRLAIGRLKGAYQAMWAREQSLTVERSLRERDAMESLPELRRVADEADKAANLPPDLRAIE